MWVEKWAISISRTPQHILLFGFHLIQKVSCFLKNNKKQYIDSIPTLYSLYVLFLVKYKGSLALPSPVQN